MRKRRKNEFTEKEKVFAGKKKGKRRSLQGRRRKYKQFAGK